MLKKIVCVLCIFTRPKIHIRVNCSARSIFAQCGIFLHFQAQRIQSTNQWTDSNMFHSIFACIVSIINSSEIWTVEGIQTKGILFVVECKSTMPICECFVISENKAGGGSFRFVVWSSPAYGKGKSTWLLSATKVTLVKCVIHLNADSDLFGFVTLEASNANIIRVKLIFFPIHHCFSTYLIPSGINVALFAI